MDRMDKSPDEMANAMSERLDNPLMRAKSRPEENPARELKYGYLMLCAAGALAFGYDLPFFAPLLVLWGITQILSVWHIKFRLWSANGPTRIGWGVTAFGLLLGLLLVALT